MKNVFKSALFVLVLMLSAAFVTANPVITDVPDQAVNEGSLLKLAIVSSAPDAPVAAPASTFSFCQIVAPLTSCIGVAAPAQIDVGVTKANLSKLSNTAAEFNWTPNFAQAGAYKFNVSVSDADSTSNDTFTVTVTDVPPKLISTATLTLGGDNQERSNPNHDTVDRREINLSGTVTLTNGGGEQLNGIKGAVALASGFIESDIMINFTLPKATLAPGESMAFPVTARIPQKLDAVSRALSPVAVSVASLAFTATPAIVAGTVTGTTQVELKAENNLRLKTVRVKFDGKSETVDNGDTIENLKPGMNVEFEVIVENRFRSREDVTIESVEVKVFGNNEIDIDESEDLGDLGAEDTDVITFESTIDSEADDGTFNVEISTEGVDEFGARHGEKMAISLEVERKNHEISIQSLSLTPSTVSCESGTTLRATIKNTGRRDEGEVFARIEAQDLSYGASTEQISLDKDDETSINFNIPVPASVKPGTYHVNVATYYNTGIFSNSDAAVLTVEACEPATEEPPVVTPPVVTPPVVEPPVNVTPQAPAKKPFTETPQYLALLVLGYVVVLGGGGLLLFKLIQKP